MSRWHVQVQHPRITRPSLTKGDGSGAVPDVLAAAIFEAAPAPPGDLVALPITTGTPTVGSPALTQTHSLAAAGLAAGTPTLGAPALTQRHALAAQGVTTGVPALAAPALSQRHTLSAAALAAGAPTLGTPALSSGGVTVDLTAQGITAGAPTLGAPALGVVANLIAQGLTAGAPVLGTPMLINGVIEPDLFEAASAFSSHLLSGCELATKLIASTVMNSTIADRTAIESELDGLSDVEYVLAEGSVLA